MVEACRHGGIPLLPGKRTCMACGIFLRGKVLQLVYLVLNKKQSPNCTKQQLRDCFYLFTPRNAYISDINTILVELLTYDNLSEIGYDSSCEELINQLKKHCPRREIEFIFLDGSSKILR